MSKTSERVEPLPKKVIQFTSEWQQLRPRVLHNTCTVRALYRIHVENMTEQQLQYDSGFSSVTDCTSASSLAYTPHKEVSSA